MPNLLYFSGYNGRDTFYRHMRGYPFMKKKLLIFLLLLSILLSACDTSVSQSNGDESSQLPGNSGTSTPTATPAPEARVALGEEAMQNGDYDTALAQFQAALGTSDPDIAAEARLGLGRVYLLKEQYNNAIQQFGWLINTGSDSEFRTKAFFFIAKSYEGAAAYSQAAEAYQNYLELVTSPLQGDILEMEGDALVSAGENARALAVYQQAQTVARPEYLEGIQLKIARTTEATGDTETALSLYQALYDTTSNTYTMSAINLYMGRIYLAQGDSEKAYARFQDSVNGGFVTSYDTFNQLAALVEAGQTVNELMRGEIDYYAGQYGMAVAALDRYMESDPQHTDDAHYFKALSLYNMGDYEGEVAEWDILIRDHPDGAHYAQAFLEKATTLKNHLSSPNDAARTLLTYVEISPNSSSAADYIYRAARIYEENGQLEDAARTWLRVINEYPGSEDAILSQFEAGICYYRLGLYQEAQVTFQKNSLQSLSNSDKARAQLWVGKSLDKQDKHDEALLHYQQAVDSDPTGYYSIRAQEILDGNAPFAAGSTVDLGINWDKEEANAEDWMREKFNIAADVDISSVGDLATNILYQRGTAFWELGMNSNAQSEFESLRLQLTTDALNSYRLMNHMLDLGLYQTAIMCARQVLDLTGLDQSTFIDEAPAYFNHVRYGVYYRDVVISAANENNIDPLILFSVVRTESLFESEVVSSMAAVGLMQIIPSTGAEIAKEYGWPIDYLDQDLTRPIVNIKLGTHYLVKWQNYFDGDLMAALAAYNAGITYASEWINLAENDPDLFLEVIRASDTRDYIRWIREYYEIYKDLYAARAG